MKKIRRRLSIVLSAMAATWAAAAGGATAFEDGIPVELAEIFLGIGPGEEGGVYRDIVGSFPAFELPAGFTVLGSLERQFSQTVYLRTAMGPEEAREAVAGAFGGDWITLPDPPRNFPEVGIRGRAPVPRPLQLCHDELGRLNINTAAGEGDGGTLVTLRNNSRPVIALGSRRNCAERAEARRDTARRRPPVGQGLVQYMPRLELPREAVTGRPPGAVGGLSSSGNREVETSTPLSIGWSPEELYAHFAGQLQAQGWSADTSWASSLTAGGSWTLDAEDDVELVGMLTTVRTREDSYLLRFRLLRR